MRSKQFVKLREFGNNVFLVAPRQAAAAVHIDSFRREPFHAATKTESAAHAGQCTKAIAQKRPGAPAGGEASVVVRLAVVDVKAETLALAKRVFEIAGDFDAGIIL